MGTSRFDLGGRVALVTGGSRGLGQAMAQGLAEAGANVVICSRNELELAAAAAAIEASTSAKARFFVADLADRLQTEQLAREALHAFGRIDILINNAGSNIPEPADEIEDHHWDQLMELNLNACMVLSRAVIPGMKERSWGRIIHIASAMAVISKAGRGAYSASKTGLLGLARAQAIDLGPFGITVNCIAPGPFLTDLVARVLTDAQLAEVEARTALERSASPHEIAGAALLLASDAGSFITGVILPVDGGMLCK
jgi:gluconate 5-dehydrogenase